MARVNLSRRNFVLGSAAGLFAVGAGVTFGGCQAQKTISGINPDDFKTNGVGTLGTGLEDIYTANVPTALYPITNKNGAEICITNFGARMVSIMMPDKNGQMKDMIIGFNNIRGYANPNEVKNNVFGAVLGRFGNRIDHGKFVIDGQTYQTDINQSPHMMHGGKFGWFNQTYTVEEYDKNSHIRLKLISPDGDMGFPGEVTFYVTYTLNDNNTVGVFYEATSTKTTVLNIANHNYWNVSGDVDVPILDDKLFICTKQTTLIDSDVLPTGQIVDISPNGTFDFYRDGQGKIVRSDMDFGNEQVAFAKGYDHNYVVLGADAASAGLKDYDASFQIRNEGDNSIANNGKLHAKVSSDVSGITMSLISTEPGIQFYDGHDLDGTLTNLDGKKLNSYAGMGLEPQHFPDWPNKANFASNYLHPGEKFLSKTEWRFSNN